MSGSQKERRSEPEREEVTVLDLCGNTCPLCKTIFDLSDSPETKKLAMKWPLIDDHLPIEERGTVCFDCFEKYQSIHEDALDRAVADATEYQKKRRRSSPSYDKTSEQALERDEYTCQLCGEEGYPKTDLGLAAFPVKARNFHLRNLVTVCHECLKKDVVEVRSEAAQAKKWINAEQEKSETDGNDETGTNGERV